MRGNELCSHGIGTSATSQMTMTMTMRGQTGVGTFSVWLQVLPISQSARGFTMQFVGGDSTGMVRITQLPNSRAGLDSGE